MNGLSFDRHKEEKAVEFFAQNVMRAGAYFRTPDGHAVYPS